MEQALAADPVLASRHAVVAAHLARYDALDAPPPPPFASVAARLEDVQQLPRGTPRLLVAATAVAAVLVAAFALHVVTTNRQAGPALRTGPGLRVTETGAWTAEDEPAEGWIDEHVHVVLDRDARLVPESGARVRLLAGRAEFEVDASSSPFVVATPHGEVRVLGTLFEVDVTGPSLFVAVGRGHVEVGGRDLAHGEALVDGRVVAAPRAAGAFYRRPELRLSAAGQPLAGEAVTLRFTFANPGRVSFAVAGPVGGVRAALWLEVVDPAGEVHDVAVPGVDAPDGPLSPGRPLWLEGRGETSFTARLGRPFGDRGTYRCRALYRPEGQPSRVSDVLLLEVR